MDFCVGWLRLSVNNPLPPYTFLPPLSVSVSETITIKRAGFVWAPVHSRPVRICHFMWIYFSAHSWNALSFRRVVGPSLQINLKNPASAWTWCVWKFLLASFFAAFFCFLQACLLSFLSLHLSAHLLCSIFIWIAEHIRDHRSFLLSIRCVCTC